MRRLWLLSSFIILVFSVVSLFGCKAKRAAQAKETEQKVESAAVSNAEEEIEVTDDEVIIHKPGTINPTQLDSIKAAKKKMKRGIK